MEIPHREDNNYPGVLDAFKIWLDTPQEAMVLQVCEMMTEEALVKLVQEATDRWAFEFGGEKDLRVLNMIEPILTNKRERRRGD